MSPPTLFFFEIMLANLISLLFIYISELASTGFSNGGKKVTKVWISHFSLKTEIWLCFCPVTVIGAEQQPLL